MIIPDPLLTSADVAQRLGVTTKTLERWRSSGEKSGPPCVRLSRKVIRYRAQDVEDFIRKNIDGAPS